MMHSRIDVYILNRFKITKNQNELSNFLIGLENKQADSRPVSKGGKIHSKGGEMNSMVGELLSVVTDDGSILQKV